MYLKTDNELNSDLTKKDVSNALGTPEQKDRRKSAPRTPKSPFVVQHTVKILIAEMMLQLLTPLKDRHNLKTLKLGNYTLIIFYLTSPLTRKNNLFKGLRLKYTLSKYQNNTTFLKY